MITKQLDRLAILLLGLKLAGFIDWSWWIVLSVTPINLVVITLARKYGIAKRKKLVEELESELQSAYAEFRNSQENPEEI